MAEQVLKNASGACLNIHMTVKWFITLKHAVLSNNLGVAPLRERRDLGYSRSSSAVTEGESGAGVLIALLICSFVGRHLLLWGICEAWGLHRRWSLCTVSALYHICWE